MGMDERRVLRLEEVCQLVGLARSTIYAKSERRGLSPSNPTGVSLCRLASVRY